MFIVITGLDGSGTSSIAQKLNELDTGSVLVRTPPVDFISRKAYDDLLCNKSPVAHMLYYLSSCVYISDIIKKNYDYNLKNVYCVRYLIDTVVSNVSSGVDLNLDYNIYGNQILEPDLTIFVSTDECLREKRINARGKDLLDAKLDNNDFRDKMLKNFDKFLDPNKTIVITNNSDIDGVVKQLLTKIQNFKKS